jgi:hypothetical protein
LTNVNNQAVALNTQKNEYYVINEMGKEFLEKMSLGIALEEISKVIAMDYNVEIDQVKADLIEFIELLSLNGFIDD